MNFPTTRHTMLSRMRQGVDSAWVRFMRQYTEPALAFLRGFRLSREEAEDVWQETLLAGWEEVWRYDAAQGRFRSWLMGQLKQSCVNWTRRATALKRDRRVTESLDVPRSPDEPDGPSRLDERVGQSLHDLEERVRHVEEALAGFLRDYSEAAERAAYLDWFWHGAPQGGRSDAGGKKRGSKRRKPAHDSNQEIAARHDRTVNQLDYLRKKVEAHLRQRWDQEMNPRPSRP